MLLRIVKAGLKLKPSKCFFAMDRVLFLGHEVSAAGLGPNKVKTKAIECLPLPTDLKSLRSFLGMSSFFRRFVKDCATLADPLIQLTKLDSPFVWGVKQQFAFNELKRRLCDEPIMDHFDPKLPIEIHTDASSVGLGAVLIQRKDGNEKIIAYASKTQRTA